MRQAISRHSAQLGHDTTLGRSAGRGSRRGARGRSGKGAGARRWGARGEQQARGH